jgi:xanthine dehydrogenase YagR molybdenum-binding subunit
MPKHLGEPRSRIEGALKVTGRAAYAADRRLPNQAYAWAVRSPIAAGRIMRVAVAEAEAVDGVIAIYTHCNATEALDWGPENASWNLSAEALGRTALAEAEPTAQPLYQPLTGSEIVFAGQWIALVVAETLEAAREAALLVTAEFVEDPASTELDKDSDRFLSPSFFFGADMHVQRSGPESSRPDQAAIRETYVTPVQFHHPMETSATVADWQDDGVTVFDSTQGVWAAREFIARSLKVSTERVRVVSSYVGGGFGAKNQMWPHQALAAHISRALRRPIRVQLSRADMVVASGHRSVTHQDVDLRAGGDGRLNGLSHVSWVPTSIRGNFFEPCGLNSLMLYETADLDVRHYVTRKNIPSPTVFRGPGETPGSFALECALDELAHRMQMDPIALRRRNFASHDAYHARDWSANRLEDCYEQGSAAFGWEHGFTPPRSMRSKSELIGFGMATTAYPAPALAATVRLRLRQDGPLVIETSATDIGTGMYTILAQTVADALGWPLEDLVVRLASSDFPNAPTAGRSKSTASVLPAAANACRALLDRLQAMDRTHSIAPDSNRSPFEILAAAGSSELVVEGSSTGMPTGQNLSFYSFGAHFAEVRVDEELGRVRVTRFVSALDCGTIVNPKTAASQIKGGIIFGIGMALMEKGEFHPVRGRLVNDNLADYAVPVHADVPDIKVVFVNGADERFNEFGARGLGEIGLPGAAAAIANAVFNATGKRVRNLPITPADIVRRA